MVSGTGVVIARLADLVGNRVIVGIWATGGRAGVVALEFELGGFLGGGVTGFTLAFFGQWRGRDRVNSAWSGAHVFGLYWYFARIGIGSWKAFGHLAGGAGQGFYRGIAISAPTGGDWLKGRVALVGMGIVGVDLSISFTVFGLATGTGMSSPSGGHWAPFAERLSWTWDRRG